MGTIWENHKTKIMLGCGGVALVVAAICGVLALITGGIAAFAGGLAYTLSPAFLGEVTESASNPPSGSPFYEDVGGADFDRIPLIEPYQVTGVNDFWQIKLQEDVISFNRTGEIAKVTVVDQQVILAEAISGHVHAENIDGPVWYVIIPDQRIEQQFTSQVELDEYLQTYGVYSYTLNDVRSVYQTFVQSGRLDWFPTSTE